MAKVEENSTAHVNTVVKPSDQSKLVDDDEPGLKRTVGAFSGVSFIVGTIIGSGIFVSPSGLALGSGSVGLSLILWAVCGLISMLGALCMAELGTLITESGGEYAYLKAAFGRIPAYLYSWVSILLLKPSACCIIALTCAKYVLSPAFNDDCGEPPVLTRKLLAVAIIVTLSAVNSLSIKLATRVQVVFTVAKCLALGLIIVGGVVKMAQGETKYLSNSFEGTRGSAGPLALAIYNGMWAYDGWTNLNYATEELINPEKNLPRCIMIAIPLVTILYILVNISYFSVMSVPDLVSSSAVAVTWAERTFPVLRLAMPVFVALSTFGCLNGSLFGSGRVIHVSARDGHMMGIFSYIHNKRHTPLVPMALNCVFSILLLIPGDIGSLIEVFNFAAWMFYGATMASLLVLRKTRPHQHRPYKVPLVFPVFVLLVSLFLMLAPIIDNPQIEFFYAATFIASGMVLYVPFVHFKLEIPGIKYLTLFVQLLTQSTPPAGVKDS